MIQSVDRALTILNLFGQQAQWGITEISQAMGLPKSTIHGLVSTLEGKGFLSHDNPSGKYRLGFRVYELGLAYTVAMDLPNAARPYVQELAERYSESVHVAIYAGGMAVFVFKSEIPGNLAIYPRVGGSLPAHTTGVGKALLSYIDEAELEKVISSDLYPLTRNTITDRRKMIQELADIREHGYAVDREEAVIGIACVAAPIRDSSNKVIAAISISGHAGKILGEMHRAIISDVQGAASNISRALGYIGR